MSRCSACGLPIEDYPRHYRFAHGEEYLGELAVGVAPRCRWEHTDWRNLVGILLSLLAVGWAGRA